MITTITAAVGGGRTVGSGLAYRPYHVTAGFRPAGGRPF